MRGSTFYVSILYTYFMRWWGGCWVCVLEKIYNKDSYCIEKKMDMYSLIQCLIIIKVILVYVYNELHKLRNKIKQT